MAVCRVHAETEWQPVKSLHRSGQAKGGVTERQSAACKHVKDFWTPGNDVPGRAVHDSHAGVRRSNQGNTGHEASVGDTLVVVEDAEVRLTHAFKPGQPNGLFDGGISVTTNGSVTLQAEVNAVCSMPDLPNWPAYDNIYGRRLADGETPGVEGGKTDWQLLLYFSGESKEKGREPVLAKRLAHNLCHKDDCVNESQGDQ